MGGKQNEDSFGAFTLERIVDRRRIGSISVCIVADGVSSEEGSKGASQLAVDVASEVIKDLVAALPATPSSAEIHQLLATAVRRADSCIKEAARTSVNHKSMSTTLVIALVIDYVLYVVHVGDSRAYLLRDRTLYRLTVDHTYVEEMISRHKLTRSQANTKVNRNVLTRYLGPGIQVEVDPRILDPQSTSEDPHFESQLTVKPGEIVLICSDGLTGKVSENRIGALISAHQRRPRQAAEALIQAACEQRETDNITAVLMRMPSKHTLRGMMSHKWRFGSALLLLTLLLAGTLLMLSNYHWILPDHALASPNTAGSTAAVMPPIRAAPGNTGEAASHSFDAESTANAIVLSTVTIAAPTVTPIPVHAARPVLLMPAPAVPPPPRSLPSVTTELILTPTLPVLAARIDKDSNIKVLALGMNASAGIYELCFTEASRPSDCFSPWPYFSVEKPANDGCTFDSTGVVTCHTTMTVLTGLFRQQGIQLSDAMTTTLLLYQWQEGCSAGPQDCRKMPPLASDVVILQ